MVSAPGNSVTKARFRIVGRKDGLVDQVVEEIEGQILRGRIAVGTKLPPEREFSERLGVSRTVVREAVRILVTKGLLETRHGIGTTVRAVTRHDVVKPMTLFLRTSGQDVSIEHLHQVRSILEVENAGLAAEQAADADIEDLRRICAEMESAAADAAKFAVEDTKFHRRLAQSTYNPLLILLIDSIHDLMAEVRAMVGTQANLFERVMPAHRLIVQCVAARDVKGARRAMHEHLLTALAIQQELIAAKQASDSA